MIGYFRQINEKYIRDFKNRVRNGVLELVRSTESTILKVILKEINYLFYIMSGRLTSRLDIPKRDEFPESKKYNKFIQDIDIDIEKTYTARDLVSNDVQNVVNFNSLERSKSVQNLANIQEKVYSVYIKSKKGLNGVSIIKEDFKTQLSNTSSKDVEVNISKEQLTLKVSNNTLVRNNINKLKVDCYFIEFPDKRFNIYPNNRNLSLGSFWKKSSSDIHFILKNDKSRYKNMMVDEETGTNIGSTQFEAVYTFEEPFGLPINTRIEEEMSKYLNLHSSFIMIDRHNSIHGKYISNYDMNENINDISLSPQVKLVIPFTGQPPISTSFIADFEPNDSNVIPTIDITESFAFDDNNNKIRFLPIPDNKVNNYDKTGRYQLNFSRPIRPSRIELVLLYGSNPWSELSKYMMSEYIFDKKKTFKLQTNLGTVETVLTKLAYVFVDSESNTQNERIRANNVMLLKGVKK